MPDDKKVGNAADGVPAPFLGSVFLAKGGEETGEDHDEIGDNGHESVGAIDSSQKTEIEEEKRRGDGPIDVASVVDLAALQVVGAGQLAVVVLDLCAVEASGITGGHGKVGERGGDCDEGGDDMVEAAGSRDLPSSGSKDA